LYCVATQIRRMPEFSAFDSAKSMIRDVPAKKTAGFARRSVSSMSRLPRPPARTKALDVRARFRGTTTSLLMMRILPPERPTAAVFVVIS
jgi:hypothetical protein